MSNMIIAFVTFIANLFAKEVQVSEVEVEGVVWKIERLGWDDQVGWSFAVPLLAESDGQAWQAFKGPRNMPEELVIHAICSAIEEELRWIEMDQERRHEQHWDC